MSFPIPVLDEAGRDRWRQWVKDRIKKAGWTQESLASDLSGGHGDLTGEMSRFVRGHDSVLRRWFETAPQRADKIAERLGLSTRELRQALARAAEGGRTADWNPVFPEVQAASVRIPPRTTRDLAERVEAIQAAGTSETWIIGAPGSGRTESAAWMRDRLVQKAPDVDVQIEDAPPSESQTQASRHRIVVATSAPPWRPWAPSVENDLFYMRPWRTGDVEALVTRLGSEATVPPEARRHLERFTERLKSGEDLVGGPWWPAAVIDALAEAARHGPPPDESAVRQRWLRGPWSSARARSPVLARLPDDLLGRLWAERWRGGDAAEDWARPEKDELETLLESLLPLAPPQKLDGMLDALVEAGKKKDRQQLAEEIRMRLPASQAKVVAGALVDGGLLTEEGPRRAASDRHRALQWAAGQLAKEKDLAWLAAGHRIADPDLPELVRRLVWEGADPPALLNRLESHLEAPFSLAPEAVVVVLASTNLPAGPVSERIASCWARAVLEALRTPTGAAQDLLPQASIRQGDRLPRLVGPDPLARLKRLADDTRAPPAGDLARLARLAPLHVLPHCKEEVPAEAWPQMSRTLPQEAWEHLEALAEAGDETVRATLSGEGASVSAGDWEFWRYLPSVLRVRWFGTATSSTAVAWELWADLLREHLGPDFGSPGEDRPLPEEVVQTLGRLDREQVSSWILEHVPGEGGRSGIERIAPLRPEQVLELAQTLKLESVLKALAEVPALWLRTVRWRRDRRPLPFDPSSGWPWWVGWSKLMPLPGDSFESLTAAWTRVDALGEAAATALAHLGHPEALRHRWRGPALSDSAPDLAAAVRRHVYRLNAQNPAGLPPRISEPVWKAQRALWLEYLDSADSPLDVSWLSPFRAALETVSVQPLVISGLISDKGLDLLLRRQLDASGGPRELLSLSGLLLLPDARLAPAFEAWLSGTPGNLPTDPDLLDGNDRRHSAARLLAKLGDATVEEALREPLGTEHWSIAEKQLFECLPMESLGRLAKDASPPAADRLLQEVAKRVTRRGATPPEWTRDLLTRCTPAQRQRTLVGLGATPLFKDAIRDALKYALEADHPSEALLWAAVVHAREHERDPKLRKKVVLALEAFWKGDAPFQAPLEHALEPSPTGGLRLAFHLTVDVVGTRSGHTFDRIRERLTLLDQEGFPGERAGEAFVGWGDDLLPQTLPLAVGSAWAEVLDRLGIRTVREQEAKAWLEGRPAEVPERRDPLLRAWLAHATDAQLIEALQNAKAGWPAAVVTRELQARGRLELDRLAEASARLLALDWDEGEPLLGLQLDLAPSLALRQLDDLWERVPAQAGDWAQRLVRDGHAERRQLIARLRVRST